MVGGGDGDTRARPSGVEWRKPEPAGRAEWEWAWAGHAGRGRCVVRGAARGWDRVARGSTRGPRWPELAPRRACGLAGLQAWWAADLWGQVRGTSEPPAVAPPAALPPSRSTRARREEARSGPTTRSLPQSSLLASQASLDPAVCAARGPSATEGRSSGSRGKLPLANHSRCPGELGCQCDACRRAGVQETRAWWSGGQCAQGISRAVVSSCLLPRNPRGPKHRAGSQTG